MSKLTDQEKKLYVSILCGEHNFRNMRRNVKDISALKNKIPQKFYRYRSLSNEYEMDNIIQEQIWLSTPTEFNQKEGLIPRSLLRNKPMTSEASLGLIPRSLLRGVSSV